MERVALTPRSEPLLPRCCHTPYNTHWDCYKGHRRAHLGRHSNQANKSPTRRRSDLSPASSVLALIPAHNRGPVVRMEGERTPQFKSMAWGQGFEKVARTFKDNCSIVTDPRIVRPFGPTLSALPAQIGAHTAFSKTLECAPDGL